MLAITGLFLIFLWVILMLVHLTSGMIHLTLILGMILLVMHFLGGTKAHR